MSDNPIADHPHERPQILPPLAKIENKIRKKAYQRVMELLESDEKIPAGQLLGFVAKIGFQPDKAVSDKPQVGNMNIFAILPGLPKARQEEILSGFENELSKARKELTSGD